MQSPHRVALAVILGVAALSGTVALSKTVHLGADAAKPAAVDQSALARRHAALEKAERSARAALAQQTPALPPVPRTGPVPVPRLAPVVVTKFVAAATPSLRKSTKKTARKTAGDTDQEATPTTPGAPATQAPAATTRRGGGESEAAKDSAEQAAEAAAEAADR